MIASEILIKPHRMSIQETLANVGEVEIRTGVLFVVIPMRNGFNYFLRKGWRPVALFYLVPCQNYLGPLLSFSHCMRVCNK